VDKKNIVLIGMPASGKSTIGVLIAKRLGLDFVDTDIVIQTGEKKILAQILEDKGIKGFLKIEEGYLVKSDYLKCVIAPRWKCCVQ
jgi:shikimate kinase